MRLAARIMDANHNERSAGFVATRVITEMGCARLAGLYRAGATGRAKRAIVCSSERQVSAPITFRLSF